MGASYRGVQEAAMGAWLPVFALALVIVGVAPGSAGAQPGGESYQKPLVAEDPEGLWRRGLFDDAERVALTRAAANPAEGGARHVLSRAAWSRRDLGAARIDI